MNSFKTKVLSCGVVAVSVLTCEKNSRMSTTSLFLVLCPSPCVCDCNAPSTICINVLITLPTVRLMFTVCFLYPRISFWPFSAINTLSHYAEINSGSQNQNSRRHFCFFSLVIGRLFSVIKVVKIATSSLQGRQSKYQVRNIRTYVYSKFVFVPSTFELFNYGTPAQL